MLLTGDELLYLPPNRTRPTVSAGAAPLRKDNPDREDEPRVPAGSPDGGEWTNGGGGAPDSANVEAAPEKPFQIAQAQTYQSFIAENCQASILREFPGQFLHVPVGDVMDAAQDGDRDAQKARKLLTNKKYRK